MFAIIDHAGLDTVTSNRDSSPKAACTKHLGNYHGLPPPTLILALALPYTSSSLHQERPTSSTASDQKCRATSSAMLPLAVATAARAGPSCQASGRRFPIHHHQCPLPQFHHLTITIAGRRQLRPRISAPKGPSSAVRPLLWPQYTLTPTRTRLRRARASRVQNIALRNSFRPAPPLPTPQTPWTGATQESFAGQRKPSPSISNSAKERRMHIATPLKRLHTGPNTPTSATFSSSGTASPRRLPILRGFMATPQLYWPLRKRLW